MKHEQPPAPSVGVLHNTVHLLLPVLPLDGSAHRTTAVCVPSSYQPLHVSQPWPPPLPVRLPKTGMTRENAITTARRHERKPFFILSSIVSQGQWNSTKDVPSFMGSFAAPAEAPGLLSVASTTSCLYRRSSCWRRDVYESRRNTREPAERSRLIIHGRTALSVDVMLDDGVWRCLVSCPACFRGCFAAAARRLLRRRSLAMSQHRLVAATRIRPAGARKSPPKTSWTRH